MRNSRGFTLIETLITTAVLVSGLCALVMLFWYSIGRNNMNQQQTTATLLLYEKMEQFKSTPLTNAMWTVGGGLNTTAPTNGYFEYADIAADGTLTTSAGDTTMDYLRLWQISGTNTRTLTVIVCVNRSGMTRDRFELARATTMVSNGF